MTAATWLDDFERARRALKMAERAEERARLDAEAADAAALEAFSEIALRRADLAHARHEETMATKDRALAAYLRAKGGR